MKRIKYYPTPEELIHLAENYNVNVSMESIYIYLYPTNIEAASECVLLGISQHALRIDLDSPIDHDIVSMVNVCEWLSEKKNEKWLTIHSDGSGFITYHN